MKFALIATLMLEVTPIYSHPTKRKIIDGDQCEAKRYLVYDDNHIEEFTPASHRTDVVLYVLDRPTLPTCHTWRQFAWKSGPPSESRELSSLSERDLLDAALSIGKSALRWLPVGLTVGSIGSLAGCTWKYLDNYNRNKKDGGEREENGWLACILGSGMTLLGSAYPAYKVVSELSFLKELVPVVDILSKAKPGTKIPPIKKPTAGELPEVAPSAITEVEAAAHIPAIAELHAGPRLEGMGGALVDVDQHPRPPAADRIEPPYSIHLETIYESEPQALEDALPPPKIDDLLSFEDTNPSLDKAARPGSEDAARMPDLPSIPPKVDKVKPADVPRLHNLPWLAPKPDRLKSEGAARNPDLPAVPPKVDGAKPGPATHLGRLPWLPPRPVRPKPDGAARVPDIPPGSDPVKPEAEAIEPAVPSFAPMVGDGMHEGKPGVDNKLPGLAWTPEEPDLPVEKIKKPPAKNMLPGLAWTLEKPTPPLEKFNGKPGGDDADAGFPWTLEEPTLPVDKSKDKPPAKNMLPGLAWTLEEPTPPLEKFNGKPNGDDKYVGLARTRDGSSTPEEKGDAKAVAPAGNQAAIDTASGGTSNSPKSGAGSESELIKGAAFPDIWRCDTPPCDRSDWPWMGDVGTMVDYFETQRRKSKPSKDRRGAHSAPPSASSVSDMLLYHVDTGKPVSGLEILFSNKASPLFVYHDGRYAQMTQGQPLWMWSEFRNETKGYRIHTLTGFKYNRSGKHDTPDGSSISPPSGMYYGYDLSGSDGNSDEFESYENEDLYQAGLVMLKEWEENSWRSVCVCQRRKGDRRITGVMQYTWDGAPFDGDHVCWQTECK